MLSSLQFPGFAVPVSSAKSGSKTQTHTQHQPLRTDVFFTGPSKPNKKTEELYKILKQPQNNLTPDELHDIASEWVCNGADPHYVDKNGKTAIQYLQNLELYSNKQHDEAWQKHSKDGAKYLTNYEARPEAKPLPETIELLRKWAVNKGASLGKDPSQPAAAKPEPDIIDILHGQLTANRSAARRYGAASTDDEMTPLLGTKRK